VPILEDESADLFWCVFLDGSLCDSCEPPIKLRRKFKIFPIGPVERDPQRAVVVEHRVVLDPGMLMQNAFYRALPGDRCVDQYWIDEVALSEDKAIRHDASSDLETVSLGTHL
jgi:hypothetical protein